MLSFEGVWALDQNIEHVGVWGLKGHIRTLSMIKTLSNANMENVCYEHVLLTWKTIQEVADEFV